MAHTPCLDRVAVVTLVLQRHVPTLEAGCDGGGSARGTQRQASVASVSVHRLTDRDIFEISVLGAIPHRTYRHSEWHVAVLDNTAAFEAHSSMFREMENLSGAFRYTLFPLFLRSPTSEWDWFHPSWYMWWNWRCGAALTPATRSWGPASALPMVHP